MKHFLKQIVATTSALSLLVILLPAPTAHAAFPGLNGKVAFDSNRDGNTEIYTITINGSNPVNLSNNPAADSNASYSADGTKIAFQSDRGGSTQVYVMDHNGQNVTQLTTSSGSNVNPAFSPDGSKIIFSSSRDGNNEIYVMDADGSNEIRLTSNAGTDAAPAWSPDGSKIAFRSDQDSDGNREIYGMDTDGSNQTNLTNWVSPPSRRSDNPNYSPDGQKIVFKSDRLTTSGNDRVWVMNTDGSNPLQLSSINGNSPAFSADGSKIIFHGVVSGATVNLVIMDADGSNVTNLTEPVTNQQDLRPSAQPLTRSPATLNPTLTLNATQGPVTYDAPANHTDTYEEIDSTSVTITTQPQKGSVAVNSTTGEITYTPNQQVNAGFNFLAALDNLFFTPASAQSANQDSFAYQICSTANAQLCTTTTVNVELAAASGATNLASTGTPRSGLIILAGCLLSGAAAAYIFKRMLPRAKSSLRR